MVGDGSGEHCLGVGGGLRPHKNFAVVVGGLHTKRLGGFPQVLIFKGLL